MPARFKWIRKPLDEARRQLVEKYFGFTYHFAAKIWRYLHRPAHDLDEIRSVALYALVDLASYHDPELMPPFDKVITQYIKWSIRYWLRQEARRAKRFMLVAFDNDTTLEPLSVEDSRRALEYKRGLVVSIIVKELLADDQKEIMQRRFALTSNDAEYKPCEKVREELGISLEKVRSRSTSAILKIRKTIETLPPDIFDLPEDQIREILAYGTNKNAAMEIETMARKKLPDRRASWKIHVRIDGNQSIYLTCGEYEDGTLGEVFIDASKAGTFVRGICDALARVISVSLQCGTPVTEIVKALRGLNFPPHGTVSNSDTTEYATSVPDWIAQELERVYVVKEVKNDVDSNKPDL